MTRRRRQFRVAQCRTHQMAGCQSPSCAPPPHGTGGSFPGEGRSTGAGTKEAPIRTSDVEIAAKALAEGKHVVLDHERKVSTLVEKLAAQVKAAKEAGEDAPNINLCNVSVPGTNLFCVGNKGIPRVKMPQLGGVPEPGSPGAALPAEPDGFVDLGPAFVEHLRSQGIAVNNDKIDARYLKATQNELNGAKVAGIAAAMREGSLPNGSIFVTSDDYVVDGHHRWAASLANELGGLDNDLSVRVIDSDIITILDAANRFAVDMGIKPQGAFAVRRFRLASRTG